MFFYFFLVIATFWILKPLKKSLFIRFYDIGGLSLLGWRLDAAQAELLAKVLNMVVAAGAVALFSLAARRFRRERLSLLVTGSFGGGFLAFTLFQPGASAFGVWTFYLFGDLFSTLMVATFFAFLNDTVNPDAARRLYGSIGLGGVLGGVVGSSVLSAWIDDLEVVHWLWICMGLGLAVAGIAFTAGARARKLPEEVRALAGAGEPAGEESGGLRAAWLGARLVRRSPYLLAIAGIVGLYEVVSTVMDFQFTSTIAHYLDGDAIGRHLSRVFALTNGVSVFVQLFVTSWFLTRLGVGAALLVLPVTILAGSAGFLVVPSLLLGSLLNTADNGFSYSINQSAKEALYVPASVDEKYHAKAFIDMFLQRLAKAVAVGLSLGITTAFAQFATVRWLSLLTLGLLLIWVPAVLYAGRRFRALAPDRGTDG
jgi:AAA family ATP:ADP antiporter